MQYILETKALCKSYNARSGFLGGASEKIHAVQSVDLKIAEGQTLGLVGESGCGKSTLGQCAIRLIEPSSGDIQFRGKSLLGLSSAQLREYRKKIQIVFQDPYSSLNPRMRISEILSEPFIIHKIGTRAEIQKKVAELMEVVGLDAAYATRYPHEFSGGQRQRIGIARAIALQPEFVVADEPVSALDVSIQAQILKLLKELKARMNLSMLFISHDLAVVEYISDWVAVMYLGKVVEIAPCEDIFANPHHPYTKLLLASLPMSPYPAVTVEPREGFDPAKGCSFASRCPLATDICREKTPVLKNVQGSQQHRVACHHV